MGEVGQRYKPTAKEFDFLLIDATFYDSKEINRDISEIPHPLSYRNNRSIEWINQREQNKVYFIHMNHTNMMLDPDSELSRLVLAKGLILQDSDKNSTYRSPDCNFSAIA